jgi:hypothetical protein
VEGSGRHSTTAVESEASGAAVLLAILVIARPNLGAQ